MASRAGDKLPVGAEIALGSCIPLNFFRGNRDSHTADKKDEIEKKEEAEDRGKDFVVGHALTNITAGTHSKNGVHGKHGKHAQHGQKSMAIMTVLVNSCQDRKMVSCVADILNEDDNMKLGDLRQQLQLK